MYQALENFNKYWVFKRQDPQVSAADLQQIKWLADSNAANVWRDYVSNEQIHPDHLTENDWPANEAATQAVVNWEQAWDSEDEALPQECLDHLVHWNEDTKVYFCNHNEQVFETTWGVFQRCWKAFLFMDNGPILLGRKKKQAVQFFSDGKANLLLRT
ncbi:DUF2947 family protein [Marinomonas epiphytica]